MSPEAKVVAWLAGISAAAIAGLVGLVLLATAAWVPFARQHEDDDKAAPAAASAQLAPGTVPARYEQLIAKWGTKCPTLSPPLLAALLKQESGFNPNAGPSEAGAVGIAQFMPGTWAKHGIDANNDDVKDIRDPEDAIPSAAKYLCKIANAVKNVSGDPVDLMLAAYNAGPTAVLRAGGIPDIRETRNYIKRIRALEKQFAATAPADGGGGWRLPINARVTTAYHAAGGQWATGRHTGIDFAAPQGTAVYAAASGTVVKAGMSVDGPSYGNAIVLKHSGGRYTQYAHLSAVKVRRGEQVPAGATIGGVGATGTRASGPHLHFEVRTGPNYLDDIDPAAYLRSQGVTVR